jgi:hypothetical protein
MIIPKEEEQEDVDILGGLFGDCSPEELADKLGIKKCEEVNNS